MNGEIIKNGIPQNVLICVETVSLKNIAKYIFKIILRSITFLHYKQTFVQISWEKLASSCEFLVYVTIKFFTFSLHLFFEKLSCKYLNVYYNKSRT